MFCPKCGSQNPDDGRFCGKCGEGLSRGGVPVQAPVTYAGQPSSVPAYSAAVQAVPYGSQPTATKPRVIIKIVIAVIAALIIAAAAFLVYQTFFAEHPCYVVASRSYKYPDNTDSSYSVKEVNFSYNDEGVQVQGTSLYENGESHTTDFQVLDGGVSVPNDDTFNQPVIDSDGYVTFYEYASSSNSKAVYSYTFEYYRPGIIKSKTYVSPSYSTDNYEIDGSNTYKTVFDEDGWVIRAEFMSASGEITTWYYGYESDSDGKTINRYKYDDEALTSNKEHSATFLLDENGNVAVYSYSGTSKETQYITYKKIDAPAKMVAATSRLKG